MRKEKDFIGAIDIPQNALYGINSVRAKENFPNSTKFDLDWYKALGLTKVACYETYKDLKKTALSSLKKEQISIDFFSDEVINALITAALEISEGTHYQDFIVPAVQGGAGTSINMNINEIIANRSLQIIKKKTGEYNYIDPFIHANIFQSTNDVLPSALRLAIIKLLNELEEEINKTRNQTEQSERKFRNTLRIAYTQMQSAVPSSYGVLFATYSDALSRDWWRVSKCFERIKTINLGGGAIGTGMAVPKFFIMEVAQNLQRISGQPLTRSENLTDSTANQDSLVEVHAIMKSHAVNLEKMASDIRLLASDISKESLKIPPRQTGSSIMPGKINPVIPEYVISVAHKVYANDMLISNLCGQSCLELNAYIPSIGSAILESLKLLISANKSIADFLLKSINIKESVSHENLMQSPSLATALIPYVGYSKASDIANYMKEQSLDIFTANNKLQIIDREELQDILKPQNLLKLGFSVKKR